MDSTHLTVAALGRHFSLGMLYDARNDKLLTGCFLWDDKFLEDKKKKKMKPSSSSEVVSSDSLKEKSSLLDFQASVKASFLSGLVEVDGSAKYLNDKKKFKSQSRVTLKYSATTYYSYLSITPSEALSAAKLRDNFKNVATHVVTGIQYGAKAFFVFDSEKLDSSQVQDFQGTLEGAITKIPKLNVEGKMGIQMGEKEKSVLDNISCKFYGDFLLENNPTNFKEAVNVYQNLSKSLWDDKNSVPVEVSLTALTMYDPSAAAVKEEICEGLITKAETVFEDLSQFQMRCNDILEDTALKNFHDMSNSLKKFSQYCQKYENHLRDTMKEKFPLIRAGKEENRSVEKLLDDRNKTPFSNDQLERWISDKEAEVGAMKICLDEMEGIKIISNESQLKKESFAQNVVHTLCFTFTSLEQADNYLVQLENSLHSHKLQSFETASAPKRDQWYNSEDLKNNLRNKARDFRNMAQGLKARVKICFLVAAIENPKHKGASIYHYKNGKLVSEDFSKPDVSSVETIQSKEDLIWYARDLTLNLNTANDYIIVSEENKRATCTSTWQYYPSNPHRFTEPQVLCNEELDGRCYWELEWSEASSIGVGVAYKSFERQDVGFGNNEHSWYFGQYNGSLVAYNNGKVWSDYAPTGGCRLIGVYLDRQGGTLSFYKVSCDKLEHLYTFKTTFTDPLYAGFYIYPANTYCKLTPVH